MKFLRSVSVLSVIIPIFFLAGCMDSPEDTSENRGSSSQVEERGSLDFELPSLAGNYLHLSKLRGSPVLLIFSTTWCAHCRSELPHFRELHQRYSPEGLKVIQIFIQESRQKVASFAKQYEIPYGVLLDEKGKIAEDFGVRGVPDIILLDREGVMICRHCENLDASVATLFAKTQQEKN